MAPNLTFAIHLFLFPALPPLEYAEIHIGIPPGVHVLLSALLPDNSFKAMTYTPHGMGGIVPLSPHFTLPLHRCWPSRRMQLCRGSSSGTSPPHPTAAGPCFYPQECLCCIRCCRRWQPVLEAHSRSCTFPPAVPLFYSFCPQITFEHLYTMHIKYKKHCK